MMTALYRSFAVKAVRREKGRKRVATREHRRKEVPTERVSLWCRRIGMRFGQGRSLLQPPSPPLPPPRYRLIRCHFYKQQPVWEGRERAAISELGRRSLFSGNSKCLARGAKAAPHRRGGDGFGADVSQSCGETFGKCPASPRRPKKSLLGRVAPKGQFVVNLVGFQRCSPVTECLERPSEENKWHTRLLFLFSLWFCE